jgi:hypothetical protein
MNARALCSQTTTMRVGWLLTGRTASSAGQKMDQKQLQLALQEIGYHLHEVGTG